MLLDYAHKIRIPDLFKSDMETVDTIALSKWMLDQTIATYALCEQKK